jgi:FixJ family two-component response regulator
MTTTQAVIHIVDDNSTLRKSLTRLLSLFNYRTIEYLNGKDFVDRYKSNDDEECVILDVAMPEINGSDLFYSLQTKNFQTAIIFLSACNDVSMAVKAIKHGAINFIPKPFNTDELIKTVQEAIIRTRQLKASYKEVKKFEDNFKRLSPKEKKIFYLMMQNKSISSTADFLKRSESTIEKHRMSVLKKLNFSDTDEMSRYCERYNIAYTTNGM